MLFPCIDYVAYSYAQWAYSKLLLTLEMDGNKYLFSIFLEGTRREGEESQRREGRKGKIGEVST